MTCKIFDHDGEQSVEHIFPDAIGGSLELDGICRPCNSHLGTAVDSALTDHYLILIKRHMLGIRSRTGRLPNPLAGDTRDEAGHTTRFETDQKGNPEGFKYVPYVGPEQDGKIEIRVDSKDGHKLLDIVKTVYRRRGLVPPTDDELRALIQTDTSLKTAKRQIEIDLLEYQRPIVKIAYELGLHWLGDRYRDDPLGKRIRSFLFDQRKMSAIGDEYKIEGIIQLHPPTDGSWDDAWRNQDHVHLGLLFATNEGVICAIRIFDVVYGRIMISKQGLSYWGGAWPKLVVLDSKARSHNEHFGQDDICTAITTALQSSRSTVGANT